MFLNRRGDWITGIYPHTVNEHLFSDDDFMSRMHAAIRNEGGKAWLVDLNSSNGTYIQVDKERLLQPGDFIRLGDQLLRFEEV